MGLEECPIVKFYRSISSPFLLFSSPVDRIILDIQICKDDSGVRRVWQAARREQVVALEAVVVKFCGARRRVVVVSGLYFDSLQVSSRYILFILIIYRSIHMIFTNERNGKGKRKK